MNRRQALAAGAVLAAAVAALVLAQVISPAWLPSSAQLRQARLTHYMGPALWAMLVAGLARAVGIVVLVGEVRTAWAARARHIPSAAKQHPGLAGLALLISAISFAGTRSSHPTRTGAQPAAYQLVLARSARPPVTGSGSARTYTVRDGESLFAISAKLWGDPELWPHLWVANRGMPAPYGRTFDDPGLILSGEVLVIPTDLSAPLPMDWTVVPWTGTGASAPLGPASQRFSTSSALPAPSPPELSKSSPSVTPKTTAKGLLKPTGANAQRANVTPAHALRQQAKDAAAGEHWRGDTAGLGVGLLAVGIGAELARRRRRRMRSVSPDKRIALPSGGAARVERRLAHSADVDGASWVDLGLRRLGAALREANVGAGAPVITGVRLGTGTLVVEAASPTPGAAPFVAKASTWRLSRTALEALAGSSFAPTPTPCLVSLGRSDTSELMLVNLEAHGVVAVVGGHEHVAGAIRAMAVELATCAWAEYEELVLVGVAPELSCVSRVRVCEVLDQSLIADLTRWAESAEAALSADGWASLSAARVMDVAHDLRWGPMVVIVGPGVDTGALEALAGRPGVVVVRPGQAEGAWVLRAEGGRLWVPDGSSMVAQELSVTEAGAIGELLAQAEFGDEVEPTEHPYDVIGPAELPADVVPGSAAVEIGVLGPITCSAGEPPRNKDKAAELLAYLVCHPEGVSPGAWEVALWRDPVSAGHRRNVLSSANQALGRAASGEALILVSGARIRLAPEVGSDWSRFRALCQGGTPEHWRQALALVRGRPFENLDSTWTLAEGHATEIEQHILATALRLAEHCLAVQDHGGVEWATKVGLSISAWDERLYRVKMASAAQAGGRKAAEGIFQQLRAAVAYGEDPMVVIEPETLELYHKVSAQR